jgi:hypothetical protein
MSLDKEYLELGHQRPRIAQQVVGGSRGLNVWAVGILARSLRAALGDQHLLDRLAGEVKAGDRLHLAAYADQSSFSAEERAEVAELLILRIQKPDDINRKPGRVWWRELVYADLRDDPERLMIEHKPAMEAVG